MDPISAIVTALVTGAAAAIKPTTEQTIKDAYAGIKKLIQQKYKKVNVTMLEDNPESKSQQSAVKENLEKTEAGQDIQLLGAAKTLLDAIQAHAADVPRAVGLDLKDIKAAALTAEHILVEGNNSIGARVEHVETSGEIRFGTVEVRSGENTPQKKA
jgi:hypothetical protein